MLRQILLAAAVVWTVPQLASAADPFPCIIGGYRVITPVEVRFFCKARPGVSIVGPAKIRDPKAQTPDDLLNATIEFDPKSGERQWMPVVRIEPPLKGNRTYELVVDGYAEQVKFAFHTKAEATLAVNTTTDTGPCTSGTPCGIISSNVALNTATTSSATFGAVPGCNSLGSLKNFYSLNVLNGTDGEGRGVVTITGSVPADGTALCISGLKNIFGDQITVKGRYKDSVAPKDKDTAELFSKFLSQAGPGARPGWAADFKLAPTLANVGHGFFFTPEVLVDVGFGKVAGTKITDTAKFALGLTKVWAAASPASKLQSLASIPKLAFETDKGGHHQNLLFDWNNKLYWRGLLHSRKNVRAMRYAQALVRAQASGGTDPSVDDTPMPRFGWQFQTSAGAEIGGALSADDTRSSDKATSVKRPTYNIARVRPSLSASLEFRWLELTLMVVPRILFTRENVTSEREIPNPKDATKTIQEIFLRQATGFRPYGEASVNLLFDREGHVALSSTYKLGSVPPNFDKVNTVQTGLLIRY